MREFIVALSCLLWLYSSSAQSVEPADAHYNIVALRIEFAPDTTRFTTGDGTFNGLTFPLKNRVDPLPHDAPYFQAHLDFLEHYIATASAGKTTLSTFLIPEIIQLDQPMANYSPTGLDSGGEEELSKLVTLVHDSWSEANQVSMFDPARLSHGKTAFLLFHAGVGRDVELIGTTLTKTPQDLPSVFINSGALSRGGFNGLQFKGIPVDHSMILPRTETRSGINSITDQPYLLELSINGLLAASFMSYLGVPDLFNTETGESVIGPYGLMDPLGIFAYGGLFPPLPSAWTRVVLGWVEPMKIETSGTYDLPVGEVAKLEISQAEYFLLENRVRDLENSGLSMQIWNRGSTSVQTIPKVSDDFNPFNIEGFQGGVVTQVNSYDFALPGRDSDQKQYNGGILIWHIDERQFARTGNNDPTRLAVDIEEADGAQDIGFDGNIGSPFDFYFEDNPSSVTLPSGRTVPLYINQFGPNTTPNSRANGGGSSFVTLDNFSGTGSVMSFSFQKDQDGPVSDLGSVSLGVVTNSEGSISSLENHTAVFTGTEVLIPSIGRIPAQVRPAFSSDELTTINVSSGADALFQSYRIRDNALELINSITLPTQLSPQSPVIYSDQAHYALFSNAEQSQVIRIHSNQVDTWDMNDAGLGIVATDAGIYVFGKSHVRVLGGESIWTYQLHGDMGYPVMGKDRTGLWGAISGADELVIFHPDGSVLEVSASAYLGESDFSKVITIVDLNQDGILDLLTTAGNQVVAFSQGGALLPPFPIEVGAPILSTPLVFESDQSIVVVVAATDGNIYASDLGQNGRMLSGFPLSAGHSLEASPLLSSDRLSVITQSGTLQSYSLSNVSRLLWSEQYGGAQNSSFVALTSDTEQATSLLSSAETYNWPNPIREGSTFFRCMTNEHSEVSITIVDVAGSLIDSFNFSTSAGVPYEIQWQTDAVSGVYYARVKATSDSGVMDSHLLKIAIIR